MKLVFISDTHNYHEKITIPECDILFHTGDATFKGKEWEVRDFAKWFQNQPAKELVYVPGNHEVELEKQLPLSKTWFYEECPRGHMLLHESIELDGLKIFGSPISPFFFDWAWNVNRGPEIREYWDAIPDNSDIVLTHGPVFGVLDMTRRGEAVGCEDLLVRVDEIKPIIHSCGHIHEGYGTIKRYTGTQFINASVCNGGYSPINKPIVVELEDKKITKVYKHESS